jgi:RimJ/RimL family protein N-acetyltransferase
MDPDSLDLPSDFQPIALSGKSVGLVPLTLEHHDELVEAVRDGELWKLWYTTVPEPEAMRAEIQRRLALQQSGSMIPFTVVDGTTGKAVGMTTYMNIDAINRRVEIGSTWYARRVQRTAVNTEAKLLLLAHAFDSLGCIAVELRTHVMNQQSRNAIERLGAKLDGILRSHCYARDGSLRDTCVYSIVRPEWPAVRETLLQHLAKPR